MPEDHGGSHAPHWDRQEPNGRDYEPVYPYAKHVIDPSMYDRIGKMVGLTGASLGIYFIISEEVNYSHQET